MMNKCNILECQYTYVKCLYIYKRCITQGDLHFHCVLQSCDLKKKWYETNLERQVHTITRAIPVLERKVFECLYSEVNEWFHSTAGENKT